MDLMLFGGADANRARLRRYHKTIRHTEIYRCCKRAMIGHSLIIISTAADTRFDLWRAATKRLCDGLLHGALGHSRIFAIIWLDGSICRTQWQRFQR